MEKYTIKETKEFAAFLVALVNAVRSFRARKIKVTVANILRSIGDFLPAALSAESAFTDAELIGKEWGDLSAAEAEEIIAIFNDGVDAKDALTEKEIEDLFAAAIAMYLAVRNIIRKNEPETETEA